MFRRKHAGEQLADLTAKIVKRDLNMGPEFVDRKATAVSWDFDMTADIVNVHLRFGPRDKALAGSLLNEQH